MTKDERAHEELMLSWIEDAYKKGKGLGDWRKKYLKMIKKRVDILPLKYLLRKLTNKIMTI